MIAEHYISISVSNAYEYEETGIVRAICLLVRYLFFDALVQHSRFYPLTFITIRAIRTSTKK